MQGDQSPVLKVSLMLKKASLRKNSLRSQEPGSERVLRVALYSHTVFNGMWFWTVDPFVTISVFIAKLSERLNCWRILEDFHSKEYIQFFDVNCGLFMSLHFSIGCYDCRRTSRRRQSVHFSRIQVLFC